MRELSEVSGLPRTTIHHYLREGLLPLPEKTAPNAAVYGPRHLERLSLLKALRGTELGPLPLEEIRRVLPLVERGVAPAAAVELAALSRKATGGTAGSGAGPPGGGRPLGLRDLAREAGREPRELRALVEAGVLGGEGRAEFDAADLAAASACGRLLDAGLATDDLRPAASLLREATAYEEALLDLATAERELAEAAELRGSLRRAFRDLNAYLLARGTGA